MPAEAHPNFEGHEKRECGEHRTTGDRAWCSECSEWCSRGAPCKGCELALLRSQRVPIIGGTIAGCLVATLAAGVGLAWGQASGPEAALSWVVNSTAGLVASVCASRRRVGLPMAEVTFRWWPRTAWVTLHLGIHIESAKGDDRELYHGIIRRRTWTVRGVGLAVVWMPTPRQGEGSQ